MTSLLDRMQVPTPSPVRPREARHRRRPRIRPPRLPRSKEVRERLSRADAAWLAPLMLLSAVVHVWGMGRAPQRVDDEGTYVAQAYAVQQFGELAHYTYWYDHPPLGWIQIAAWTWPTRAFERADHAVTAGREAMLVAHLAAVVLVWLLARRMELTRPTAAGAVLLFALSPLAVAYHRMVYIDNVATPWMLAAFVLAAARRHQLASYAGAAACLVMAVLTKETYLLLLPALVWWAWRHAEPSIRRYTLTVAGALTVVLGLAYAVFAVLRGELVPGSGHVSLLDGIAFQLVDRAPSGSVLDRDSQAGDTVEIWLQFDAILPVAATLCAVAMLFVRRVRPIAAAYLLLLVVMLRPGYLPVPYVVAMLPFGALLVAAAAEEAIRRQHWLRSAGILGVVTMLALALPAWSRGLTYLTQEDLDQPVRQAQGWLTDHADRDERLLVDDAVWVDLVRSGFPRENVVWYYKADTDPEVAAEAPDGWLDYDYLLVTESVRRSIETDEAGSDESYPILGEAYRNSEAVVAYGQGNERVEVRRVSHPVGGLSADRTQ